jgi:hypothetical protein
MLYRSVNIGACYQRLVAKSHPWKPGGSIDVFGIPAINGVEY